MPTGTVPIVAIFTPKRVKKYTYGTYWGNIYPCPC